MALLVAEGFEHIHGIVDAQRRFTDSVTGIPASLTPFVDGRRLGGRCLRATDGDSFVMRTGALAPGSTTAILGFAVRSEGPFSTFANVQILNSSNQEQISVATSNAGGVFTLLLKVGATILATSPSIPLGTFAFVELFATIHATLGVWEFRVNEMTIASGTGNTSASGTTGFSKLSIDIRAFTDPADYTDIDDLYLLDTAGDAPFNRFLGNIGIESLTPFRLISEGTFPWTPNTGTNKEAVDDGDEGPVDDDTTHVAYTLQDKMDLFSMNKVFSIRSSMLNLRLATEIKNTGGATEPFHSVTYLTEKENVGIFAIQPGVAYERIIADAPPVTSEDSADTLYGYANTLAAQAIPVP